MNRTIFSHSRSEQFWKQNTKTDLKTKIIVFINLQVDDHDLDYVVAKPKVFAQFLVTDCPCGVPVE